MLHYPVNGAPEAENWPWRDRDTDVGIGIYSAYAPCGRVLVT